MTPALLLLAATAWSSHTLTSITVTDQVDMVEINTHWSHIDEFHASATVQAIFWERVGSQWYVVDYEMLATKHVELFAGRKEVRMTRNVAYRIIPGRAGGKVRWYDRMDDCLRQVSAPVMWFSDTTFDPEYANRRVWPKRKRTGLSSRFDTYKRKSDRKVESYFQSLFRKN